MPCSERPVSASTDSPNNSDNDGWAWINRPTSAGVASQLTREVRLRDQLGRPRPGDVHAEDRAVALGDDLHHPVGLADDERAPVAHPAVHRRLDVVAALLGLRLGEPAERDLGVAVDAPRHLVVVDRAAAPRRASS